MITPTPNQITNIHQKMDNDSDQLWEEEKAGLFLRLFSLYFIAALILHMAFVECG